MVPIRRRRKSNQSKFGAWSEADCALFLCSNFVIETVFCVKKHACVWRGAASCFGADLTGRKREFVDR